MDQATVLTLLGEILGNLSAAGPALIPILYALLIASFLDTLIGSWAAVTSGSFSLTYVAEFLRSHVALKVAPILMTLLAGVLIGGTDNAAGLGLIAAAGAQGTLYLTSVVASIRDNLSAASTQTKGLPSGVTEDVPAQSVELESAEIVDLDVDLDALADKIAARLQP